MDYGLVSDLLKVLSTMALMDHARVPLLACPAVFLEQAQLDKPAVAPEAQHLGESWMDAETSFETR
jgi:hypothetical protein